MMVYKMYIVLYSPSNVQKITDFLKTVYTVNHIVPVIVKPLGAAAQIGIPEAHRIAYKLNKPIIVLPEIRDLTEILKCEEIYYMDEHGEILDLKHVFEKDEKAAFVISAGDLEPSKKELENLKKIWPNNVPKGIPATALTGILIYLYLNNLKSTNIRKH